LVYWINLYRRAVSLPVHTGLAAAAFVVSLLLFITKRLEHLQAVAIFNVRTGDLNAIAVIDLGSLDLAAIFFHIFSPPFVILQFYNNRIEILKKYLLKKIFYGIERLLIYPATETLAFTLTNDKSGILQLFEMMRNC